MIILLDSSTPTCYVTLVEEDRTYQSEWEANRELAHGLLAYLETTLKEHHTTFADITGLGVFKGPGSFTGLRIGLTVLNTLADANDIPIVGAEGEDWQETALSRLRQGENDRVVLPLYGGEAHITSPRK